MLAVKRLSVGLEGGRTEHPFPPASSTLFVEGLPANCTCREVSRYKEVRRVSKESRRADGDSLMLCFVNFVSPAHVATAMDALQADMEMIYCERQVF
ncbi:hypothetical protein Vadar_034466 [Vaccinium darrowii]|uniref:Uncharacterized protein n=1 Tax=Vaccinium darrowii TaxID=229202 RepID=A0ACB7ZIF1_9ERIC|nr:hypothetical protein Vadar_034466 [Vaccinium darrowii]